MNLDDYIECIQKKDLSDEKKTEYIENVKKLYSQGFPIFFNIYQLSNLIGIKYDVIKSIVSNPNKYYDSFLITKKKGGKRKISSPSFELSMIQTYIKENILENIPIHSAAYGFVKNKDIISNAYYHINQEMVLNIDLKDFFPSINKKRIFFVFYKLCGYSYHISMILAQLVTYKDSLPQGACTSPILSNIVSYKMDIRLHAYSKKIGIKYTRYADDITFSGNISLVNNTFLKNITRIINECGYELNDSKTRFCSYKNRQDVTGLLINGNYIHIPQKYIKEVRQELYFIKKFGLRNHLEINNIYNKFYYEHLLGKILYIKRINEEKGKKLLEEFTTIDWEREFYE